jgi:DNA polymerase-4
MDRVILHSDMNCCYASIEHALRPELDGVPLAVGGCVTDRHGIILAKDEACKRAGVKTGMALWQARQLCPEMEIVAPRMDVYLDYSARVQKLYGEYTNLREPFGIDESWLDLTGCVAAPDGVAAAQEIRARVKAELHVTVSVGVSWNKIFAKLGSDYKKPDAVTVITRENYRSVVWPLPVEDLLYVGRATSAYLHGVGIHTIGALANSDPEILHRRLGKMGYTLHAFANGLDDSPVRREDLQAPVKSIGNSTTAPRDLVCDEDVRITLLTLAESVGARLRAGGFKSRLLSVSVRSTALTWRGHQLKLEHATNGTRELLEGGMALFRELHDWRRDGPIRSLGLSAGALESVDTPEQLDVFGLAEARRRQSALDTALDAIRGKYGFASIRRGPAAMDPRLGNLNAREEHIAHPIGFFGGH